MLGMGSDTSLMLLCYRYAEKCLRRVECISYVRPARSHYKVQASDEALLFGSTPKQRWWRLSDSTSSEAHEPDCNPRWDNPSPNDRRKIRERWQNWVRLCRPTCRLFERHVKLPWSMRRNLAQGRWENTSLCGKFCLWRKRQRCQLDNDATHSIGTSRWFPCNGRRWWARFTWSNLFRCLNPRMLSSCTSH